MAKKPPSKSSYRNRHVSADGTSTECLLTEEGGVVSYSVVTGDVASTKVMDPGMDYAQALASEPGLLLVGTGYTDITFEGPLSLHDLLGLLVVDEPNADGPNYEDWVDEDGEAPPGVDLDDLCSGDEEMMSMSIPEGFDIVPRWVMIDGERGFVLRGEGFAAIGLVDAEYDWNKPILTDEILSWRFYGESGGPCSWDGRAELGWCGRRLWTLRRWGDYEPVMHVFPSPKDDEVAEEVTAWILGEDWELPFLLDAVGLPGLSKKDLKALWSAGDVEGNAVSSHLSDELNQQVVETLCTSYPELTEAVSGLRNPDSERGRVIYGWLRQIAHGTYQSGSWNDVHQAMLGQIGVPADDQQAPTMQERFEANVRTAAAAIQEAQGISSEDANRIAASEAYELLKEQVHSALNPQFDETRLKALRARLDDVDEARQAAAASRGFLGFEDGGPSLHKLATDRIAENPDGDAWVADVWSAYWSTQRVLTSEDETELRTQLREETRSREAFDNQLARSAKDAEAAGWSSTWPHALHEIWTERGGTVSSATAWAQAGYDPVDVILGNPPTPSALDDLTERLRDEEPHPIGKENGYMTEEEAELQLAELWRDVETGWNSLASIAQAIAVGRGFVESSVAFEGDLADGERYSITWEEFLCIATEGQEFTISREDSVGSAENQRWQELELAAEHLNTIVPPVVEGRVENFDDLKGNEDDVRMVLFADYDGDGNFEYDDNGLKTIISGVWL